MKNKILIVNNSLQIAGAEKLVYEICKFAKNSNIHPTVLIPYRLEEEYYDQLLKKENVKVVRVHIIGIKKAFKTKNLKCIYWNILVRFGLRFKFNALHFINLNIASLYHKKFNYPSKNFWHVGNKIQFPNQQYPFRPDLFSNENNNIIYCNSYQIEEIKAQYGKIKSKEILFKLFLNKE